MVAREVRSLRRGVEGWVVGGQRWRWGDLVVRAVCVAVAGVIPVLASVGLGIRRAALTWLALLFRAGF